MLTVLFATRNGASTLPRTLNAMAQLQEPEDGWKLVVVDNGSTDGTEALLNAWAQKLPLTIRSQTKPGKNAALNTGLECVVGDLLVLTDDDVVPRPDWLLKLRSVAESNPAYDVFGGRIEPLWEVSPPEYLQHSSVVGPLFSVTAPDLEDGPVDPGLVWGPNMAIRTHVFAAGFRFDETIGPSPNPSYTMGSETEFTNRLVRHGHSCFFTNEPVVAHIIPADHLDHNWIFGRARRHGRGQARLRRRNPAAPELFGVPRWMMRRLAELPIIYAWATLTSNQRRRFEARWEGNLLMGRLAHKRTQRSRHRAGNNSVSTGDR